MKEKRIHQIFEVSVELKGLHAILECLGGLLLAIVSTSQIVRLVDKITQDELIEDRHDFVAIHLVNWARGFSVDSQHFYAFYLLSHGVVKLALVIGLLREKRWAYPASLTALALFIAYQLYRYAFTHGVGLLVLTVFDLFVMVLVWHEYRLVRHHLPTR